MNADNEIVRLIGRKVKNGYITWAQAAEEFNIKTSNSINGEAFRARYRYLKDDYIPENIEIHKGHAEYETHNIDGTIEVSKDFPFDPNMKKTPNDILKMFGYSPDEWEIVSWTFGTWEVAIKDENENRRCTTIRAKIKPIIKKELTREQYLSIAEDVFKESINPIKIPVKKKDDTLNKNKMLELTGIELHLGKLAWNGDTGQDYDKNIAQGRFYKILNEVVEQQDVEKCDTCLVCIGNDFFNSDTVNNTTTKGTPQQNDMRFKKMFNTGLEMYTQFLLTLREKFNHIEVRLQSGNHDYMSSFYLYIALSCYFKNDSVIKFSNDYKDVQCFKWGKCAIFYSHGDTNLKRLIKSIPSEFYKEWGSSIFRELHLGHLHSEIVIDDNSGLVTRRVGSPTGTDAWHYEERFIGATQKYQTFVWDKNEGLLNVKYITFNDQSQTLDKPKVRKLTR